MKYSKLSFLQLNFLQWIETKGETPSLSAPLERIETINPNLYKKNNSPVPPSLAFLTMYGLVFVCLGWDQQSSALFRLSC